MSGVRNVSISDRRHLEGLTETGAGHGGEGSKGFVLVPEALQAHNNASSREYPSIVYGECVFQEGPQGFVLVPEDPQTPHNASARENPGAAYGESFHQPGTNERSRTPDRCTFSIPKVSEVNVTPWPLENYGSTYLGSGNPRASSPSRDPILHEVNIHNTTKTSLNTPSVEKKQKNRFSCCGSKPPS